MGGASEWEDRAEIREVLQWYFLGLDRRDPTFWERCFTRDVEYGSGPAPDGEGAEFRHGRDVVIESLRRVEHFPMSSHVTSSQHITIDGDKAAGDTFAVAFLVAPGASPSPLLVRGLRYLDRLRRTDDGWKIERRIHIPTWQFDATSVPVDLGMR